MSFNKNLCVAQLEFLWGKGVVLGVGTNFDFGNKGWDKFNFSFIILTCE